MVQLVVSRISEHHGVGNIFWEALSLLGISHIMEDLEADVTPQRSVVLSDLYLQHYEHVRDISNPNHHILHVTYDKPKTSPHFSTSTCLFHLEASGLELS